MTEWYVNHPDGVRQWFRVDEAPAGDTLNVTMRLDSDLEAAMNGDELRLSEGDRSVARFAGLQAWDARQARLPASMRVADGRLIVAVDIEGAAYPITIDPVMFSEVAKLTASDGAEFDKFGFSVSLSGDRALVGAIRDDDNGNRSGSAYVFDFNGTTWSETAKLTASDGAAGDEFGGSVSLSGDRALVGAAFDDDNGQNSGSAYVFDFNGTAWSETAKLTASDVAAGDAFSFSLSLSGDRVLVGADPATTTTAALRAQPICSISTGRSGARRPSSRQATARRAIGSAARSACPATGRWSGRGTTTTAAFGLGLCVRLQRHELEPDGQAYGQRRRGG